MSAADLTVTYKQTADRLIDAALGDNEGYSRLTYLCYRIGQPAERIGGAGAGHRMERGADEGGGIEQRADHSDEGAALGARARIGQHGGALEKPLHMLGLGMSVGTPPGGITAEVVTVSTFDDLAKLGREKIQGKIVLYNEEYRGYGPTRVYRATGASRAAAFGAVAALVRSATPLAMQIPHTGEMNYDESAAEDSGGGRLARRRHDDRVADEATACR